MSETEIIIRGGIRAYLADLIFPSRCPFCDDFIPYDRLCCEDCFNETLWADENICPRCGKSIMKGCLCEKGVKYDLCVPATYYSGGVKDSVYKLKFRSETAAIDLYGRIIAKRLEIMGILPEINLAVPVPMAKKNLRIRGYNQAELLAKAIIKGTNISVNIGLIIRKNVTRSQHDLSAEERHEAVTTQYFPLDTDIAKGKTVLLVDDVLTTGSTLNYCAGLLKEKLGAKKIICAVAATV
ncbi:MAG: double zinc ribbon domain-containing protein [Oscillospiraceae bacterium]|nr:double zinc ribbon domain-containing protein [Oscillospiraceae bacterium]